MVPRQTYTNTVLVEDVNEVEEASDVTLFDSKFPLPNQNSWELYHVPSSESDFRLADAGYRNTLVKMTNKSKQKYH